MNDIPAVKKPHLSWANTAKGLLWQDPLLPLLDKQVENMPLAAHYRALNEELSSAARAGGLAGRLTYPALITRALSFKVDLRRQLAAAYLAGNRATLQRLLAGDVQAARAAVDALWKHHRALWMETNKPFGWEVLEHRYGGLMARLATLKDRVADYLAGRIDAIPELDATILDPWPLRNKKQGVSHTQHSLVKTPSKIK